MAALLLFIISTQIVLQTLSKTNTDLSIPLPLSQGFQITGGAINDHIATSVNYAGDVNHDGIDDIIIGASMASPPGFSGAGIVYVIYGKEKAMTANIDLSAPLSLSDGFQILGGIASKGLGQSVSYAGDFNNDGVDDIIIGAGGFAYVIYGRAGGMTSNIDLSVTLPFSQGFQIFGAGSNNNLGVSVSFAGDVNKDGIDDIIIGANLAGPSIRSHCGAAYVIYGVANGMTSNIYLTTNLVSTQGFKIVGGIANGQLGLSVRNAGDFNKDGYDDVVVGAPYSQTTQFSEAGIVVIIYGKPTAMTVDIDLINPLPISQGFQFYGGGAYDRLGSAVSGAGDVNKDGIDDLILGAYLADRSGYSDAGSAYIIYGIANGMASDIYLSNPLPISQGFRIDGAVLSAHVGCSVSYAGDVNKDGVDDVIVGSDVSSPLGRTGAGTAYIIYGKERGMTANIDLSTPLLLSQGFTVIGGASGDGLGLQLSAAGDFNKDGIADIIMTAQNVAAPGRTDAGAVYVLYDPPYCSSVNCIACSGSKCKGCAIDYLLYVGDGECYTLDTCPSGTVPNATHCVDALMETLGVVGSEATQGISIAATAVALVNFNNPSSLIFNALAGILMYMQYMSITYPPKLQYFLDQPGISLIVIQDITEVPEAIDNNMLQFVLPDNFEKNGFPSSFLVNFWPSLMNLLIICIAIVVVCLAEYMSRNCKFLNSQINKLKEILKWNYLLASFSDCYGDIALFSSFEFRTDQFGSFLKVLSFSVCIMANIALIVASFTMFTVSVELSQQKTMKNLERLKQKLSSYQVVFDNFKSTSFSQQSFFLISCLRFYLFYTILAYLFEYPLTQAILINAQCLLFLAYLIVKRPLNSTLDLIASIVLELILEIIHICVLGFAIINQQNPEETIKAVGLGDVVIGCIFAFLGAQSIYMVIQVVIIFMDLIKFIVRAICLKQKRKNNRPISSTKLKTARKLQEKTLNLDQVTIDDGQDTKWYGLPERVNGIRPMERAVIARRLEDQPTIYMTDQELRTRPKVDPRFQALWDMIDKSRQEHSYSSTVKQIPVTSKPDQKRAKTKADNKNNKNTKVKKKTFGGSKDNK